MYFKIAVLFQVIFVTMNSASLVGGPADVDIADSGVQNALEFAVTQHNMQSNDLFVSSVSKVISAKKQVICV